MSPFDNIRSDRRVREIPTGCRRFCTSGNITELRNTHFLSSCRLFCIRLSFPRETRTTWRSFFSRFPLYLDERLVAFHQLFFFPAGWIHYIPRLSSLSRFRIGRLAASSLNYSDVGSDFARSYTHPVVYICSRSRVYLPRDRRIPQVDVVVYRTGVSEAKLIRCKALCAAT